MPDAQESREGRIAHVEILDGAYPEVEPVGDVNGRNGEPEVEAVEADLVDPGSHGFE